jgi:hypothetical protein
VAAAQLEVWTTTITACHFDPIFLEGFFSTARPAYASARMNRYFTRGNV